MSKANGAIEKKDTFLQHVSLKNYKSIKDVEIDFKPGLNIIIGKNASGKTNFVNGLSMTLNFNYNDILDSESVIGFFWGDRKIEIEALIRNDNSEEFLLHEYSDSPLGHDIFLKINDEKIEINDFDEIRYELIEKELFLNCILIKYGIQYKESSSLINVPFSFTIVNNGKISRELMSVANISDNRTEFLLNFFHRLQLTVSALRLKEKGLSDLDLKSEIIQFSTMHFRGVNSVISKYTPIKEIRVNPDFKIIKEENGQKQSVVNFFLEFLIDNSWVTFNLLSDGTKRLFFIISEMTEYAQIGDKDLNILLLEEPELGIHPHQLHQLMQFIKEQSKEKQIILTTHSPQVLDILGPDELDRVIICHSDPKNGTKLSHLTEKEMAKAKKYMKEEAFLSDYWRFSDLEPAS